jgi:hypothetical protein
MGIDTKRIHGVGGGYTSRQPEKSVNFITGMIGQDGTGALITSRLNDVFKVERKETTDQQKRRTQGYRGL